ncbi:MAG: hypothetical protein KKA19_07610 [Candidatus Margulisbacteria bacterium]|nr:hypothetical protein [Candidatus Margulisiibacteriota bacterium]
MKKIKYISIMVIVWLLGIGICEAAVSLYLAPTNNFQIINYKVTYYATLEADTTTNVMAIGDIFLAYEPRYLEIIQNEVEDLATHNVWDYKVLDFNYKQDGLVSNNYRVVRFAKISLHEKMELSPYVPVKILKLPFKINPKIRFSVTRLYFPQAMIVDNYRMNVLRKISESFLIREGIKRKEEINNHSKENNKKE